MTTARASLPARGASAVIRGYQLARGGRPSPCRYWPTCSQYALEAVAQHGAARGTWLAIKRVARCHPWGGHGVDPVPDPNIRSITTRGERVPLTKAGGA